MFSLFRKACLLYKTSKIVFSRFIFEIYWHGNTGGYQGLQGVTRGYKGLEGVTSGYKGLQGVTEAYKGLHGVTNDYRNCFLTRTFPDTFSWSFLQKNQSWRNLQIFDQFCGFLKTMFSLFRKTCLLYKTSKIVLSRFIFTIYDIGIHGVTRG